MKKHCFNNPTGVGKYTGLLLVLPFVLGFLLFTLYPFAASFINGMRDSDGNFEGFSNYSRVLSDSDFLKAVGVTLKYTLLLVPLKLAVSLAVALLLSMRIKGMGIYRTIFYIPSILGSNLAVVIMWQFLFTSGGLANQVLRLVGMKKIGWYSDENAAMFMIILLRLWEFGSAMILFLNALKDIPEEYYDAAKVDGCGNIRAFFTITLPLLKNVIFLNLVLQVIAAMQEFNAPYMLTGGNPFRSTYTLGMLIYDEMFAYHDSGFANAASWILFVIITAVVAVIFKITDIMGEDRK